MIITVIYRIKDGNEITIYRFLVQERERQRERERETYTERERERNENS